MRHVEVHRLALVESDKIGAGTRVWAFSHVMAGAVIGRDCNIGEHCFVEDGVVVGDGCVIKNGVSLWRGTTLEECVFVGPGVTFTNDRQPRARSLPEAAQRYADDGWLVGTSVGRGASLGARAVLLPGLVVGPLAVVAAGALVTRDVPPHALVMGRPARQVGWVDDLGRRVTTPGPVGLAVDGVVSVAPSPALLEGRAGLVSPASGEREGAVG